MEDKKKGKKQNVKVEVVENGPLRITGTFVFKDLKRNKEETTTFIELCRCGRTNNKPFCDCSHGSSV